MSAKLIAEEGLLAGLVLSFDEGEEWIIGRDPSESQLLVSDPEASRQHLKAHRLSDGSISVENLSQTNPVQVNDQELKESRVLKHGDALKIGSSRFRFYTEIGGPDAKEMNGQDEAKLESKTQEKNPMQQEQSEQIEENQEEKSPREDDAFLEQNTDGTSDLLAKVDFGLEEAGPFMLKVIRGPNSGAEFSMQPGRSYTLGTAPHTCDVVFHDISVSRQHAKLTIEPDNRLFIEDLGSRNGILIDDHKVKERTPLGQNVVVSLGTTSFIIFDRESERHTIITPFLPSIVKTLQKDESKKAEKKQPKPAPKALPPPPPPKKKHLMRNLAILGLVLLLAGFSFGTSTLFKSQVIQQPEIDAKAEVSKVLATYPALQFSFTLGNGRLLLLGHLLSGVDKNQLMYQLQALPFIKSIDDKNLVIDEYVWKETNQILSKNPAWGAIAMRSPTAGRFEVIGYLKTRKQADQLQDFLAQNFSYLDRLDNKVIVEEDETNAISALLQDKGFRDVSMEMHNGEVTLTGTMAADKAAELNQLIKQINKRPTIRLVRDYVTQLEPEQSIIDLSDSYHVTGSTVIGGVNVSVVINGRILSKGDLLDGMTIDEIKRSTILLERDRVKYKIEYNK